ncbi:MAG: hypothetical protein AAFO06_06545 [Cyanobacteria bacterium J06597_16]
MELKNIEHMESFKNSQQCMGAGSARRSRTGAYTYAGADGAIADAFGQAFGDDSLTVTTAYTTARKGPFSKHAAGVANAYAAGSSSGVSRSTSRSSYRATSRFGSVESSNTFSSSN